MFLQKEPCPIEVLNDRDGEVVQFFEVLRTQTSEFVRAIELTPYARAEYDRAFRPTDDPFERARRFFVRSLQSYGGPSTTWRGGWRTRTLNGGPYPLAGEWNAVDHLWAVAARLKMVHFENRDWWQVVEQFDHTETAFYLDPPYLPEVRAAYRCGRYRCDMDAASHAELLERIQGVRGMVLLSGYPSELYTQALSNWTRVETTAVTDAAKRAVESLWLNPAATDRLRRDQLALFEP